MKLIKDGDLSKIDPEYYFKCDRCGCEFVAKQSECYFMASRVQWENDEFIYTCPTCGVNVYGVKKRYEQ